MKTFINKANSSKVKTVSLNWFRYVEQRYLPAFAVAFPEKPIVVSKAKIFEEEGKHYACDTALFNQKIPDLLARYEVYFAPVLEKFLPLTGKNLKFLAERFIASLTQKEVVKKIKFSEVEEDKEKITYLNFLVTSVKAEAPILFAGRILAFNEKYLYCLLVKPQNLLSKTDYDKFINSFEVVKE